MDPGRYVRQLTRWLLSPGQTCAAGIFALLGGLCYAELGAAIPESGGEYEYFRRAFHGVLGKESIRFSSRLLIILQAFLVVWSMWLVLKSGKIVYL
jgi:amino acid transporter